MELLMVIEKLRDLTIVDLEMTWGTLVLLLLRDKNGRTWS